MVVACGETLVSSDTTDASTDGSPGLPDVATDSGDVDASDDVTDAAVDVGEFDLEPIGPCPRPLAGSVACTGVNLGVTPCAGVTLFDPTVAEHVFEIVADRRHVFWLAQPYDVDAAPGGAYNGNGLAVLRRVDRATGAVAEIARRLPKATNLFAYGPNLFFATESSAGSSWQVSMMRKDAVACSTSSCAATPVPIANGLGRVFHMAAFDLEYLFVVQGNGALFRVNIAQATKTLIGETTSNPALTVVDGAAHLGGGLQPGVESYAPNGTQLADLGVIPDASLGSLQLATTCSKVYARAGDNRVLVIDAGSDGGAFIRHSALPDGFLAYSVTSDERFLYYGAANFGGLRRVDTTVPDAAPIEIATGSVWGLAVTDDAIIYGTHGETGSDASADIGSIISIPKK